MKIATRLRRLTLIALIAATALSLSACAHRDLIAPCTSSISWGGAFAAGEAGCGLMRPAN
jgi:hypothetical protein